MIAGRFSAYEKIPFKLFINYLEDIKKGKKFFNIYESVKEFANVKKAEHGKYSFGVDEIFLNDYYLGYLIKEGKTIGILAEYTISYPVYYLEREVKKHRDSVKFFEYILNKKGNIKQLYGDFQDLFYFNYKSERAVECGKRFYEVIEKYPNWLGHYATSVIEKLFKGYIARSCIVLIKNNKVIDIKDL